MRYSCYGSLLRPRPHSFLEKRLCRLRGVWSPHHFQICDGRRWGKLTLWLWQWNAHIWCRIDANEKRHEGWLIKVDRCWQNMIEYDRIWWNMMEYDGIWWNGTGHVWPQFFNCFHAAVNSSQWLVSVAVAASGQVAVILDPSAVEPSESLGLERMERYGKIWKDMERYGKIWKDMERYGKIWKDMERYKTKLPMKICHRNLPSKSPRSNWARSEDWGLSRSQRKLALLMDLMAPSTLSRVLGSSSMSDAYMSGSRTSSNVSHSVYLHQPVFAVPGMCLQKSLQLAHKLNRAQQRKRFVTRVDSW